MRHLQPQTAMDGGLHEANIFDDTTTLHKNKH